MKSTKGVFSKALIIFVLFSILTGLIYPALMTGIGQLFFPRQANGSIIEVNGVKYGSELLGQRYTDPAHMWGRVEAWTTVTDKYGNTLLYAGASNKSPAGEEMQAAVKERVEKLREADPDMDEKKVPIDLVTGSGSGLDPEISPAAAEYQVPRIAEASGKSEDEVRAIVEKCTKGRWLGIFGEPRVNVLKVNLMLDGILTE